jgi:hypothetical protein
VLHLLPDVRVHRPAPGALGHARAEKEQPCSPGVGLMILHLGIEIIIELCTKFYPKMYT